MNLGKYVHPVQRNVDVRLGASCVGKMSVGVALACAVGFPGARSNGAAGGRWRPPLCHAHVTAWRLAGAGALRWRGESRCGQRLEVFALWALLPRIAG